MTDLQKPNERDIPPMPGGGSWAFDEHQWAWVSNDPAPTEATVDAAQADAVNELAAAPAAHQE